MRSVLGAEKYAFADAYDSVFTVKDKLERRLKIKAPIAMLTDSISLFNVTIKPSKTTEKWLMNDLSAAEEAYES